MRNDSIFCKKVNSAKIVLSIKTMERWWLTEYFMLLYFEPAFHIAKWTFKYNEWFIEWLIYFSMLKIELFPCVWIIYILLLIYDWLDRGNRKVRVKNRCVWSERKWAKFAGGICLIENNSPFIPLFSHYYIYKDSNIMTSMTSRNMKLTQRYTCSENNNTRPSLPSVLLLDIDEPIFFTPCEIRQRDARIPGYWNFRWLSRSDWRYNHESTVDRDATNRVIRSDPLCPIEPPRRRSLPALHRSCIRALG